MSTEAPTDQAFDCSELSDDELLTRLHDASLPGGSFHHRDHVRVTWMLLQRMPLVEVLSELSQLLRGFAAANGAPELYHETITWAYIFLIAERAHEEPVARSWAEFEARNPDLIESGSSILGALYSPDRLGSALARTLFVLPRGAERRTA